MNATRQVTITPGQVFVTFSRETDVGSFRDAMIFTTEEYAALGPEALTAVEDARATAWVASIQNAPPPMPLSVLTPYGFLSRFTIEEQAGMSMLEGNEDPQIAAIAKAFSRVLLLAQEIDLNEAVTQSGVAFLVQTGVLTEERAAAVLAVS